MSGAASSSSPLPTLDDVERAARRVEGVVNRTPVLTSRTLDAAVGASVFAKAECFQRAGAFKFRGAFNAVAALPPNERERGVATYSSGNHAQALALAAALHDVPRPTRRATAAAALQRFARRADGAGLRLRRVDRDRRRACGR